ncbi:unnamed protein product [Enterobius vermicularis]|uniref:Amphiphysin n=1 Tax=Enterobius vermicularis TaxID=51028 RepID=A0A0N4VJD3_ENTVE|nr:unnamed protein product [Enterobius vermicularis]
MLLRISAGLEFYDYAHIGSGSEARWSFIRMSELFSKKFKKQKTRVKEKLLEGLGKAKATQDNVFDQHASNLVKQTKACEKLFRDLKAYGVALKSLVSAQQTLRDTIRELYEPDWPERENLCAITHIGREVFQSLDSQWAEFEKIVSEQLMGSVNAYMSQLPTLKEKVAKRGRKLVDFDGARNSYNAIKASSKKGEDDPKVVKAATDFENAKALYHEINNELLDALPAAYDSRITFFVDTLQTLFNAESTNHSECAKYNKTLVTHLDTLGNAFDSLRVPRPESASSSQHEERSASPISESASQPQSSSLSSTQKSVGKEDLETEDKVENKVYPSLDAEKVGPINAAQVVSSPQEETDDIKPSRASLPVSQPKVKDEENSSKEASNPFDEDEEKAEEGNSKAGGEDKKDSTNPFDEPDDSEPKTPDATAGNVEKEQEVDEKKGLHDRKVLYKVRATHRYAAEDTDELTFDAGEVIAVLDPREEDQLDDGWLLGVKQSDGVRGVFPANFTKTL